MVEGWELKFSNYISEKEKEPFKWGENDCILFAVKAYEIITGINHYHSYLPYNTEEEAKKILKKNGGFLKLFKKHLGEGHNNFMMAKRGDLVLLKDQAGIVDDTGQYVLVPSEIGLIRKPLNEITWVWSK